MVELIGSMKRCLGDPRFLDTVYDTFLGSSLDISERFSETDLVLQKRALSNALRVLLQHAAGHAGTEGEYLRLARRHGPDGLNIPSHLYRHWTQALMAAVERHDPRLNDGLREQWNRFLRLEVPRFIQAGKPAEPVP